MPLTAVPSNSVHVLVSSCHWHTEACTCASWAILALERPWWHAWWVSSCWQWETPGRTKKKGWQGNKRNLCSLFVCEGSFNKRIHQKNIRSRTKLYIYIMLSCINYYMYCFLLLSFLLLFLNRYDIHIVCFACAPCYNHCLTRRYFAPSIHSPNAAPRTDHR